MFHLWACSLDIKPLIMNFDHEIHEINNANMTHEIFLQGYDLRAHLKQIMTFSDDELDDEYDSSELDDDESLESFDDKDDRDDELRKLAQEGPDDGQIRTPLPTGMNNCQSLIPISGEFYIILDFC